MEQKRVIEPTRNDQKLSYHREVYAKNVQNMKDTEKCGEKI